MPEYLPSDIWLEKALAFHSALVTPIYLELLGANFMRRTGRESSDLNRQISHTAQTISDDQIDILLKAKEWRGRLVAGWSVGISGRITQVDQIGQLLLASEMPYAGQGYCTALGLVGDARSEQYLIDYLRKYLPMNGRYYDQLWAIGALAHISETAASQFVDPILWSEGGEAWNSVAAIERFMQVVEYLKSHEMTSIV